MKGVLAMNEKWKLFRNHNLTTDETLGIQNSRNKKWRTCKLFIST